MLLFRESHFTFIPLVDHQPGIAEQFFDKRVNGILKQLITEITTKCSCAMACRTLTSMFLFYEALLRILI